MSDFWTLWNKAETGDVEAAHQVNVLVARQAGALVDRTGFVDSGEIRFKDDAGKAFPDYMNDLNAALSICRDHDVNLEIWQRDGMNQRTKATVERMSDYQTGRCVASTAEAALIGAYWIAETGEAKP